MTLTPCSINIIRSLSQVTVSVYLYFCLNYSPFSLVISYTDAKNRKLKKMIASMIQR